MKRVIRKILKEETNICNILNVNSYEEIISLLNKTEIHPDDKVEINKILVLLRKNLKELPTDFDNIDTYFHDIQSVVCKRKYPELKE